MPFMRVLPRYASGTIDGKGGRMRAESISTAPVFLALLAGACFGAGGLVSKLVVAQGFAVADVTCAQLVNAMAVLGVICLIKRYRYPGFSACAKLAGIGVFNAATTFCYYLAIGRVSVSCAVAFQFQYVWMALALACASSRKLPSARSAICAALIVPGSLLGSGLADEAFAGELVVDALGLFLAIACALFYALYMHLNAKIEISRPPLQRTFFTMVGAAIFGLAVSPLLGGGMMGFSLAPYGLLMGMIMSVIPCACLAFASAKLPSSLVAALSSSELPVAIAMGAIALGEAITPLKVVGIVIVCAAIAASNRRG